MEPRFLPLHTSGSAVEGKCQAGVPGHPEGVLLWALYVTGAVLGPCRAALIASA